MSALTSPTSGYVYERKGAISENECLPCGHIKKVMDGYMCETVVYVVGSVKALVNITNYIYINTVRVVTICKPMFNVISRDFSYPHLDSTSWLLPPTPAIFKPIPTSLTMSSHRNLTLPTHAVSLANIPPPPPQLFSRSPVMVFPHNHVHRWKHSNSDCAG